MSTPRLLAHTLASAAFAAVGIGCLLDLSLTGFIYLAGAVLLRPRFDDAR